MRGKEDAFVDMNCFNYPTKYTLCVSVQHLDVLCAQSDGFKYLSLFESYGVARREACILMYWAEHGCFLRSDEQLKSSVSSGALREACVSLGGGFSALLAGAYKAVAGKPTSATEDVQDEYEWRIIDVQSFESNNEELEKLRGDGWVFVKDHSSSTVSVKRMIFNRKRVTSMKTE